MTPRLTRALVAAFVRTPMPSGFEHDVAAALDTYRAARVATDTGRPQRDAVQRVLKSVRALKHAMKRAEAALGLTPPPPWTPPTWLDFIPAAWRDLGPLMATTDERLVAWLARGARPAPPDHRFHLRIAVFQALQQHGVAIRGKTHVAARVLAVVLAEADLLDGAAARGRTDLNTALWARWRTEHRDADALLRAWEADGIRPRASMIQYLTPTRGRRRMPPGTKGRSNLGA